MALTDIAIRNAKTKDKTYKIYDGGGLYIEITPSGGKLWRFKYRFDGKEKRLAVGKYPDVSLLEARERRELARKLLANNSDPSEIRRIEKQRREILVDDTFETVARDWFERHLSLKAKSTRERVTRRLEMYVFPYIGHRPISTLTTPDILEVARRVEGRSLDTAHRVKDSIGQVIRYAIQIGRATIDPTVAMRGALPPIKKKHFAAPNTSVREGIDQVCEFLRMMDDHKGSSQVSAALKLLPLLFCRPVELRTMRWKDVDLDRAEWCYTVSKTKTDHLVPLSKQAVEILRELHKENGDQAGGWVFPGGRLSLRPMSDGAINAAYRRMGIDTQNEITGHEWRSVARTMLKERLKYDPEFIERQLAHSVKNVNGSAYESPRVLRRLLILREWSHEQIKQVFPRSARTRCSHGARASRRVSIPMVGH